MKNPSSTPAQAIQLAADITKACATAGITDASEIPALIAFAKSAEDFNTALVGYQKAQYAYNRFIATHDAGDPGQEEYVREVTATREIYNVARRAHDVALHTLHIARGLEAPAALAA
jgi:hypothetical protein